MNAEERILIEQKLDTIDRKTNDIYVALFVSDGKAKKSLISRIETLEYQVLAMRKRETISQDEARKQRSWILKMLVFVSIITVLGMALSQLGVKLIV